MGDGSGTPQDKHRGRQRWIGTYPTIATEQGIAASQQVLAEPMSVPLSRLARAVLSVQAVVTLTWAKRDLHRRAARRTLLGGDGLAVVRHAETRAQCSHDVGPMHRESRHPHDSSACLRFRTNVLLCRGTMIAIMGVISILSPLGRISTVRVNFVPPPSRSTV
jgi:hypothetical protein